MLHKLPLNRSLLKNEIRITSYISNTVFNRNVKNKQTDYKLSYHENIETVSDMISFKLRNDLFNISKLRTNVIKEEVNMTEKYINYFYKNH